MPAVTPQDGLLGVACAWPATARTLTGAEGRRSRALSRGRMPGARMGVPTMSAFCSPRIIIGPVRPGGAHAEVGQGDSWEEPTTSFEARRGRGQSRGGTQGDWPILPGAWLALGASLGWALLPGVQPGSQSEELCRCRASTGDHSSNVRIPCGSQSRKCKSLGVGSAFFFFSLFLSEIRFGLTAYVSIPASLGNEKQSSIPARTPPASPTPSFPLWPPPPPSPLPAGTQGSVMMQLQAKEAQRGLSCHSLLWPAMWPPARGGRLGGPGDSVF